MKKVKYILILAMAFIVLFAGNVLADPSEEDMLVVQYLLENAVYGEIPADYSCGIGGGEGGFGQINIPIIGISDSLIDSAKKYTSDEIVVSEGCIKIGTGANVRSYPVCIGQVDFLAEVADEVHSDDNFYYNLDKYEGSYEYYLNFKQGSKDALDVRKKYSREDQLLAYKNAGGTYNEQVYFMTFGKKAIMDATIQRERYIYE